MSPDAASSAPSRPFRGQSPIAETHIVIAGRRPKPEEAPGLERVQDWQNRGRVGRRRVPGQLLIVEQVFDSTVRDVRGDERKPRPLAADYERSKAFTTVAAKR